MREGIELTEEQYRLIVYKTVCVDGGVESIQYDRSAKAAKQQGYIKKSALEEARAIRKEAYEPYVGFGTAVDLLVGACDKYEEAIKELQAKCDEIEAQYD